MTSEGGLQFYVTRLAVAVCVLLPVTLGLFSFGVYLATQPVESFAHVLGNVVGFYAGYGLVAAGFVSLVHSWIHRRSPRLSRVESTVIGGALGAAALVPQALVFGPGYWLVNLAVGFGGGAAYGVWFGGGQGGSNAPVDESFGAGL